MDIAPQRIAFIGGYGHHLLRGAFEDPTVPVEAVAIAPDRHDVAQTRKRYEGLPDRTQWYDDAVTMLESFKPTVVNVGGVYAHNAALSVEALRRDVPVVSEKPVAATWDDLAALREAARRPRRVLLTEFNFRSVPAFRAARQAVRDGRLGTVALATAQKSYRFGDRPDFYRRRADYGSTLLWVASHGIDAVTFTTGQPFATAAAAHGNLTRPDYDQMEDHCAVLYTLANGATAVIHGDLLRPTAAATHGDDRLRLIGSAGQIEVRDGRCVLITHDAPEQDITDTVEVEPAHRELLAAVQAGGSAWYNTDDTLRVAAALLAARDAADERRVVQIDPAE